MPVWQVDILIEPSGREVSERVIADDGKAAIRIALGALRLEPHELLHTIFVHIGRPITMQHDFILLDRSGSMADSGKWPETLSAVNGYVAKLAEQGTDTGVTLAVLDHNEGKLAFDIVRDRIIPRTWHKVTDKDCSPRGWTPLNDAVGRIVTLANQGGYDKVAIIIMTDGQENHSVELSTQQARALLDQCRTKGWQVIFLGADFDNVAQAESYGNAAKQSFTSSTVNLRASASNLAAKRASYGATGQAISMTDDEKAALASQKPVKQ